MNRSARILALAGCVLLAAGGARAGAPAPEQRQGDFAHACVGGPNRGLACTVASQVTDCPRSSCALRTAGRSVPGVLTIIAHDTVTDWLAGSAGNQALTVLLEVKASDGSKQLLAATYQDMANPLDPPLAPGNVVAIGMDEVAVRTLAAAPAGLLFVRPESILAAELRELLGGAGTPVLVGVDAKRAQSADHTADGLATVLRFKVKVQFAEAL